MTVSSATTRNSYSGNASNDTFAYGFKIFDDDDIKVIIRTDSTGAETVKTKTTHYTVTNVGNSSGGNVVFTSGNIPASGETVVLLRTTARTQLTDYVANDPFPAETHENALDKLTFIVQELEEEAGRSLKVSQTNVIATSEFTADATARANKILGFDGSGDLTVTEGKVDSVTASVSAVSAGGSPTASATYTASSGALALAFGLVTGNTGATGSTGSAGAAGKNTGLAMTFSNSTSDADPGAGKVAFNNGTVSSVTEIYFDDVDDNSATVSSFIQSWDDVTNTTARGILLIVKETDPSVYGLFKVSGAVTNASGYSKVPVTHVVSNGSFSNTDGIQVSFAYSGADGSAGSAGSAASIAVGSVTANTLSAGSSATAAVANAGSSSAGQFNFTFGIPTGATGATGAQGPQGPAGSGDMSDVIDDTSPQLGGDLDVVTHGLVSTSNRNIALTPNGSGVVRIDGSNGVDISEGAISIKNGGAQSYVRMYCESSNAHYVQLQAPAHANFSGNVTATLPNTTGTIATTDDITALAIALG